MPEYRFQGRTAVTELLVADEVFRDAVLQKLPTRALQDVAIRQGMQTMWQNGLRRVTCRPYYAGGDFARDHCRAA
jgi:type II secretory ATPase GspE/PulE/Tfp pilus assembly ATPase PilB-like protein